MKTSTAPATSTSPTSTTTKTTGAARLCAERGPTMRANDLWPSFRSVLLGESPEGRPTARSRDRSERASKPPGEKRGGQGEVAPLAGPGARVEAAAPGAIAEVEEACAGGEVLPTRDVQAMAEQLLRGVSVAQIGGQTVVRLELSTRRLGALGLELRVDGGKVHARIAAADGRVVDLLRASGPALEAALARRGLEVAALEVGPPQDESRTARDGQRRHDPPPAAGREPRPHRPRAPEAQRAIDFVA